MVQTTQDTIKYIYFFSNGHTYENPQKVDFKYFEDKYGDKTEQEIIDRCNTFTRLEYFIGTQADYDLLGNQQYYYYKTNGVASKIGWMGYRYLYDGNKFKTPTFKEMVTNPDSIEITKSEYEILYAKNQAVRDLNNKVTTLRNQSAPKIDAYVQKCTEYMTTHIDKIPLTQLPDLKDNNGKMSSSKINAAVADVKTKIEAMKLLGNTFLDILKLIESGTVADIDKLPTYDPIQLNNYIDSLWDKQQESEKQALMKVMGWTKDDMMLIDKYALTNSDEEYQEPVKEWSRKKTKSLQELNNG